MGRSVDEWVVYCLAGLASFPDIWLEHEIWPWFLLCEEAGWTPVSLWRPWASWIGHNFKSDPIIRGYKRLSKAVENLLPPPPLCSGWSQSEALIFVASSQKHLSRKFALANWLDQSTWNTYYGLCVVSRQSLDGLWVALEVTFSFVVKHLSCFTQQQRPSAVLSTQLLRSAVEVGTMMAVAGVSTK